ncbi:TetR/AcrR family transcriptional regulator [Amycolatopsis saalfeldensis]|uniref:DNA-binding transcriptional regulator, AcrR family n=1 Tax=Amycolatopsis saalfeldensis TaxID=394193 RepID=A0A1H8XUU1_9PSEU|nr:TetR/AcrR family transcriptional regulator [Amycolatopsis saalfeldensis]SEP43522.1 DNA-binding transcriptional regulator, AcrR family [Amycolatopsis saalfeldensis]
MPGHPNHDRADRILDAASELLVRWGSRKVTIDDVARRAGIGKGTVYLHWRTKDVLFGALLTRAAADLLDRIATRLRTDPGEAVPHRYLRSLFLDVVHDPLLSAMLTNDVMLLGHYSDAASETRAAGVAATDGTFEVFARHGLLRADVPDLPYALSAATIGFYLRDSADTARADLTVEDRADAMARVVRAAFEPPGEPDPAAVEAAATELRSVSEAYVSACRAVIYTGESATAPG